MLRQANANVPFGVPRPIPPSSDLETLLFKNHQRHTILDNSCRVCRDWPRTLVLAFRWVESHSPLLRELVEQLEPDLQEALDTSSQKTIAIRRIVQLDWSPPSSTVSEIRPRGAHKTVAEWRRDGAAYLMRLAWWLREADHLNSLQSSAFRELQGSWSVHGIAPATLLDLTYLPPYSKDVLKAAQFIHHSSKQRKWAAHHLKRSGISRPDGELTSQDYWTACAGPLAVTLRPHIEGRKKKHRKQSSATESVPEAVWQEILSLWHARYPDKAFPSPSALRQRVLAGFSV